MEAIFTYLYTALYGNFYLALFAAFMWGLASVGLSPCHLSSIPLVVSVMTGKRVLTGKEAFKLSFVFSLGILISIALIGIITALLGRMIGDLGPHANLIFGIALILAGLLLMDIIPLGSISLLSKLKIDGTKSLNILMVGILFGLALGPCAFAFMAPVLTLVFSMATTKLFLAIMIMLCFSLGHCLVIVFAGTSVSLVQNILNWNEKSKGMTIFKKVCAGLVIIAGIYLMLK